MRHLLLACLLALGCVPKNIDGATAHEVGAAVDKNHHSARLVALLQRYYADKEFEQEELHDTLRRIGELFETPALREFEWSSDFVYAELVRFNQLLNVELEKEGFHAYIVEQQLNDGAYFLRVVLGHLADKKLDHHFDVLNAPVRVDVVVLSDLQLGAEDFLHFHPSFFSDRGVIYGLRDMWRDRYGAVVWRMFQRWRERGLDPARDDSLGRATHKQGEDRTGEELVYRSWRPLFTEHFTDQSSFAGQCGDAMMADVTWEEAVHAALNRRHLQLTNRDEALPQMVSVSRGVYPHALLAELYHYRNMPTESPYRAAYERAVSALAVRVLSLSQSEPASMPFAEPRPTSAVEVRQRMHELDEAALQRAAKDVIASWLK